MRTRSLPPRPDGYYRIGRSPDLRVIVRRRLPSRWRMPTFSPLTVAGTVPDLHRVPLTVSVCTGLVRLYRMTGAGSRQAPSAVVDAVATSAV